MALSGRIFPIHHGPNDGEALSSWLTRLAIGHHLTPSIFFRISIRSQKDIFKQDIDIKCPQSVLREISVLTGKSLSVVEQTTFVPFQDYLYIHNQASTALPRWIGPTFIRKSSEHHFGLRICPLCMQQSPYIRLLWRCIFFVVCPLHGIKLLDRCENCGSPKSTRRIFAGVMKDHPDEALCYCHCCGWDYRQATVEASTSSEKRNVNLLLQVLKNGFYKSQTLEVGYSHLFFAGIRLLMNGILRLESARSGIAEKNVELEFQPLVSISSMLEQVFALLEHWPNSFVEFSLKNNFGKSYWVRPREMAPYWLSSILKWSLSFEKYSASAVEIECASKWLKNQKNNVTGKNIVAALGVKSPPRHFHRLAKSNQLSKAILHEKMTYLELENRCFMFATKFVALRTILYATIYMYTPLKKIEVTSLTRTSNINDSTQFRAWLISIGFVEINSKILDRLWERYRDYLALRDAVDVSSNGKLFLSRNGTVMDESLAIKSLERLLL